MQICDYGSGESVFLGDYSHMVEEEAAAEEGYHRGLKRNTAPLVWCLKGLHEPDSNPDHQAEYQVIVEFAPIWPQTKRPG